MPKDRRSGSALVLAVLFLIVLVPMVGLAIDGTSVYMMRNQIASALNAAVLAGNRSLSLGANIAAQTQNAQNVAINTFNANTANMYSNVKMNVNAASFQVSQNPQTMMITVSGSVTATLPLMMMGMMVPTGPTFTVSASSNRRPVNIMLVLDDSGPMWGAPIAALQTDTVSFLNTFVNGTDSIGLVTFTSAPYVAAGLPNFNFQSNLPGSINGMSPPSFTGTGTAAALSAAYQQLQNLNQPGALNVIVLFTVGLADAVTGNFAGLVTAPTPCSQTASPLKGVLFTTPNPAFGTTAGLADPISQSVSDNPELRFAPGCAATVALPDPSYTNPSAFLSGIPTADLYGNSTNGKGSIGPYTNVNLNSVDYADITDAGENALDDAANKIRSAQFPTGNPVAATIYVIGLTNAPGGYPPDPVLMPRIANDPSSASYNGSQPAGQYFPEPSPAQLQSAFTSIASQVLRLAAQ